MTCCIHKKYNTKLIIKYVVVLKCILTWRLTQIVLVTKTNRVLPMCSYDSIKLIKIIDITQH